MDIAENLGIGAGILDSMLCRHKCFEDPPRLPVMRTEMGFGRLWKMGGD